MRIWGQRQQLKYTHTFCICYAHKLIPRASRRPTNLCFCRLQVKVFTAVAVALAGLLDEHFLFIVLDWAVEQKFNEILLTFFFVEIFHAKVAAVNA